MHQSTYISLVWIIFLRNFSILQHQALGRLVQGVCQLVSFKFLAEVDLIKPEVDQLILVSYQSTRLAQYSVLPQFFNQKLYQSTRMRLWSTSALNHFQKSTKHGLGRLVVVYQLTLLVDYMNLTQKNFLPQPKLHSVYNSSILQSRGLLHFISLDQQSRSDLDLPLEASLR